MSIDEAFSQFVTLSAVLNPATTIPVFLHSAHGLSRPQGRRIAVYSAALSFIVLLFCVVFFELLLDAMHIPLSSFQLAGSLVLLIYALHMVFDQIKTDDSQDLNTSQGLVARAVYPLTVPGIAGPGTMMTVVLLTENHRQSFFDQMQTVGIVAFCLAVIALIFLAAEPINRMLGRGGINIITRVMGLILSSIALTNAVAAIKTIFGLR
jgi:multiple antibiotic resistance protein